MGVMRAISFFVVSSLLGSFVAPITVSASVLYLNPAGGEYQKGSTFVVTVRLETEGECVNAVNAVVTYPKDELTAFDVSTSQSIITLWVEPPRIDAEKGEIHFQGGIPNGYCGRISGDPGYTNVIGQIAFRKPGGLSVGGNTNEGVFSIGFNEAVSEVLLNDGLGTPDDLEFRSGEYVISPSAPLLNDDVWLNQLRDDRIPPESFTIELVSKPDIKNGAYFIVFSTTDKQSGIDEYQVMEEAADAPGYNAWKKTTPVIWQTVKSPYVLRDQTLNSIIRVRAIDKAGNERVSAYIPKDGERTSLSEVSSNILMYIVGGGVVVVVLLIIGFIFMRKKKEKPPQEETIISNESPQ